MGFEFIVTSVFFLYLGFLWLKSVREKNLLVAEVIDRIAISATYYESENSVRLYDYHEFFTAYGMAIKFLDGGDIRRKMSDDEFKEMYDLISESSSQRFLSSIGIVCFSTTWHKYQYAILGFCNKLRKARLKSTVGEGGGDI